MTREEFLNKVNIAARSLDDEKNEIMKLHSKFYTLVMQKDNSNEREKSAKAFKEKYDIEMPSIVMGIFKLKAYTNAWLKKLDDELQNVGESDKEYCSKVFNDFYRGNFGLFRALLDEVEIPVISLGASNDSQRIDEILKNADQPKV